MEIASFVAPSTKPSAKPATKPSATTPTYSERNPRLYSPEFTVFVSSLLKRANLNDTNIRLLLSEDSLEKFRASFTHKSISRDADINYEVLEIRGDGIINAIVVEYIRDKFPRVVNVMWITKLKHYLISKGWLALMAEKLNFMNYIWVSDEIAERFREMTEDEKHFDLIDKNGYMSILEDTMEAFIGALMENIKAIKGIAGPGYATSTEFLYLLFDEAKITLRHDLIFDPKTRIKELFERKEGHGVNPQDKFGRGYKWNFKRNLVDGEYINSEGKTIYTVKIYGYPLGDQDENRRNAVLLASTEHPVKLKAQFEASENALKLLRDKYNIKERTYNPYKRTN